MVGYLPRGVRDVRNSNGAKGAIARPVFGIDIDGTLGKYHEHFLRFARGWLGVDCWPGPRSTRGQGLPYGDDLYDGTCPMNEYMGVSKARYRQVKLAYRRGGLKRSMPVYPGASALVRGLRAAQAEVWLCTTRPFLQHEKVEPDTREWLRRNRIPYDGVLAGEHKYRDLVKTVGSERVVAVLDDLPEMLQQAQSLGLTAVLMSAPHNSWFDWVDGREGEALWTSWFPVTSPYQTMMELLTSWRCRRGLTNGRRMKPIERPVQIA